MFGCLYFWWVVLIRFLVFIEISCIVFYNECACSWEVIYYIIVLKGSLSLILKCVIIFGKVDRFDKIGVDRFDKLERWKDRWIDR